MVVNVGDAIVHDADALADRQVSGWGSTCLYMHHILEKDLKNYRLVILSNCLQSKNATFN